MKKPETELLKDLKRLAETALKSPEVCSQWKSDIKGVLNKGDGYEKQKMVGGVWYITSTSSCLVTPLNDKRVVGYFRKGDELDCWGWKNDSQYYMKKLTPEETEKLIESYEAAARGNE